MKLSELIKDLGFKEIKGPLNIEISGVSNDSRQVKQGDLFVCIKGFSFDGHSFVREAIEQGSVALVIENDLEISCPNITTIKVSDSRRALSLLANRFYNFPSQKLNLIGVTGTNGKTTIVYMLRSILSKAGYHTGLLSTAQNIIGNKINTSQMTTMESLDLQKNLAEMVKQKLDYVVIEVSSHALQLSRVVGCDFEIGIFTNISKEHFEIHKDFSHYLEAKKKLFLYLNDSKKDKSRKFAIINLDEEHSRDFISCNKVNLITYGLKKNAQVRALEIEKGLKYITFLADTPAGREKIYLNFGGEYNIYNALAAIAAAITQKIPLEVISQALKNFYGAPGRYKILDLGQDYTIIIDFAHNYHGLGNILKYLRNFAQKRIITVFGHGGEKYHKVRPVIGRVLGNYCDHIIITADNPKSEDPLDIAREIEKGVKRSGKDYNIIVERVEAIKYALSIAKQGDIVLIAGKGPENEQIYQHRIIPHNDEEVVKSILRGKGENC